MPFAVYSTTDGSVKTVLAYAPSSDPAKQIARTAAGLAVIEAPDGSHPSNCRVDLSSGLLVNIPLPHAPCFIYEYDTNTGMVMGHTQQTIDLSLFPDSAPGIIVSQGSLNIFPRWILTLDGNGMPTTDADGNLIATAPAADLTPNQFDLLLTAAVNAGTLDPSLIPSTLLDAINTRMATVGATSIQVTAKSSSS